MPKISDKAKEERKNTILKHAFKIFSDKGYSNTTIDDIVISSGISKGGIYTYFRSKEEIFIAIAEERFVDRRKLIESFSSDMTSKEKIEKYIEWILNWVVDVKNLLQIKFTFEFWSVTTRNSDIKKVAMNRYEKVSQDLSVLLKEGVERGEFKSDIDIEAISYIILSSTDGVGFSTGVMGVCANEKIISNIRDMILNFICNK